MWATWATIMGCLRTWAGLPDQRRPQNIQLYAILTHHLAPDIAVYNATNNRLPNMSTARLYLLLQAALRTISSRVWRAHLARHVSSSGLDNRYCQDTSLWKLNPAVLQPFFWPLFESFSDSTASASRKVVVGLKS